MSTSLRDWFGAYRKSMPAAVSAPVVVEVSDEVMDASFDRSAGRWCESCQRTGSHHTEKHNEFARAALEKAGLWPVSEASA